MNEQVNGSSIVPDELDKHLNSKIEMENEAGNGAAKKEMCTARESNPGHPRGRRISYH